MQFIIQNLNFHIPDTKVQFTNLNLSFTKQKYGLVGDNGIGKTSFFKLLSGELLPHSGRILVPRFCYLKQEPQNTQSIAEMLEISPILQALKRIQMGSTEENDFDLVQNHWDLEEKVNQLLQDWGMDYLELSYPFQALSGGEKTKIQIIKAMLSNAELILLDEPSNH